MDADTRARCFEPFFTTKEKGKGTGLGLATVYGIVAQSRGLIQVDSAPGQGTTFAIDFPLVPSPDSTQRAEAGKSPLPRGKETILLVEDAEGVRKFAQKVLWRCGYTVLAAGTPSEAVACSTQHVGPIHLVIADVVLPEASGPALVDRLLTSRPEIRVLYMSGYTDDMLQPFGFSQQGLAFLPKPVTPDRLARAVRQVLDGDRENEEVTS